MADILGNTIAALATAPLPAGLAVIRVSGPQSKLAVNALFRGGKDPVRRPRTLVFGEIVDFKTGEVIDRALAVFMPSPWSYTGEDVAEFQFHGSPILVQRILRSLYAFGVTPAEPGEFTRRGFLNGKIDLAQAEAISDLISAKSDEALKLAGEQLEGRLSTAISEVGEPLRNVLAELEASIDFPEEDIHPEQINKLQGILAFAEGKLERLIASYSFGQAVKEGVRVLICGRPNAGKSSLLNRFLGRDRAIVSVHSGTTRDLIEEESLINGHKFVFCDSAGIRESDDEVERVGIELAKERVVWADLVLLVVDASDEGHSWEQVASHVGSKAKRFWLVVNKVDLDPHAFAKFSCDSHLCQQSFFISVKTGDGVELLMQALVDDVAKQLPVKDEASEIITNERHRDCLLRAQSSVASALRLAARDFSLEMMSADIRSALLALDEIVGRTYTEDILGRIFSKFCIGK